MVKTSWDFFLRSLDCAGQKDRRPERSCHEVGMKNLRMNISNLSTSNVHISKNDRCSSAAEIGISEATDKIKKLAHRALCMQRPNWQFAFTSESRMLIAVLQRMWRLDRRRGCERLRETGDTIRQAAGLSSCRTNWMNKKKKAKRVEKEQQKR